jgi:ADP-ribose pyrophosphatase
MRLQPSFGNVLKGCMMKKSIPKKSILIPDNAELMYKGVIYDTYHWQQRLYDGSTTTFEMLKRLDTAQIIAVKDNTIVLINETQIRHAANLHFPTGKIDADEEWLAGAKRELREETGLSFANWKLIQVQQPNDQIEWFIATYLATDCVSEEAPQLEGGERSSVVYEDFSQVKQLIEAGRDDLKHSFELFHGLQGLQNLLDIPTFQGQEIER